MRNGPSSSTTPSIPGRRGSISRPLKKQFPSKFIAFFRIVSQACAVLVGLPALFALSAAAQPANDDFANAQLIPVDQPLPIITTTSTLGATIEAAETALDPSLAASVWFKVTSPVDDLVQLDTFGSDFQTRLVVGVGSSLATLDVIAADHEPRNGSSVVFEVNTGVEYHFGVFGWNGETGNLSLNLREITGGAISGTVTAASATCASICV